MVLRTLQGALRDLSKRNHEHTLAPAEQVFFHSYYLLVSIVVCASFRHTGFFACDDQVDDGNGSDGGTAMVPGHNNLATFPENENGNPAFVADR